MFFFFSFFHSDTDSKGSKDILNTNKLKTLPLLTEDIFQRQLKTLKPDHDYEIGRPGAWKGYIKT